MSSGRLGSRKALSADADFNPPIDTPAATVYRVRCQIQIRTGVVIDPSPKRATAYACASVMFCIHTGRDLCDSLTAVVFARSNKGRAILSQPPWGYHGAGHKCRAVRAIAKERQ